LLATVWGASAPGFAADDPGSAAHFSLQAKAVFTAASTVTAPDGTDVVVLEDQETVVFDAEGRSVHTTYTVFKVLTQKGAEGWADVSMGWEPWHEKRPVLRARVITPDFALHDLDPNTVSDAPARQDQSDLYSDSRVLRAPYQRWLLAPSSSRNGPSRRQRRCLAPEVWALLFRPDCYACAA